MSNALRRLSALFQQNLNWLPDGIDFYFRDRQMLDAQTNNEKVESIYFSDLVLLMNVLVLSTVAIDRFKTPQI